jgi:hypothetical protein
MTQPIVIVACRIFETLFDVCARDIPTTYLEYGFHRTPKKMPSVIQAQLDAIAEPSRIVLGYGLCGNGIVGIKARQHTLIVPRTDDCIAILLGSRARYAEEFNANPGTYYLTRGWLESGSHPLAEYETLMSKYDEATADWLIDQQYRHYRRLVFIALDQADLELHRARVQAVADFCAARWQMVLETRIGTGEFIERLMREQIHQHESSDDFLIIPPGGEITQAMFVRLR